MSIKVQCPNPTCGKVFSVKTEYAGRKAKCPGCSSPLIIPTPDAGGAFDFGSLGSGPAAEPANPFAELDAAAPPKSKSVKPPAAPEPPPPPAPPPVVEVVAEPEPPPVVVAISEPESPAAAEPFAAIAETTSATQPVGAEPWYYRFLAGYAMVLLVVGVLAAGLSLIYGLWSAYFWLSFSGVVPAVLAVAASLLSSAAILLGFGLTVAFILLIVDMARNIREIRRQTRQ